MEKAVIHHRAEVARLRSCIRNQLPLTSSDAVALLAAYDDLRERMDAVEDWAIEQVEGDGLRRVLWPVREGG